MISVSGRESMVIDPAQHRWTDFIDLMTMQLVKNKYQCIDCGMKIEAAVPTFCFNGKIYRKKKE